MRHRDLFDVNSSPMSRRSSLGIALGGLAWAASGGRACARQPGGPTMPYPSYLCPIAPGGSWPDTYIYYYSPCYVYNGIKSCPGPSFGATSPVSLDYGCGNSACIPLDGSVGLPPTKVLPTVGAPVDHRPPCGNVAEAALHLHKMSKLAETGRDPIEENTPFKVCALPGGGMVQERARKIHVVETKDGPRAFVCLQLYFPRFMDGDTPHGNKVIGIGREITRAPKAGEAKAVIHSRSGKYARIEVGNPSKDEHYHIVGSTAGKGF